LELTISLKGAVESVAILDGNPILAEAAVQATKQWYKHLARPRLVRK
jgi:hypothetical protein